LVGKKTEQCFVFGCTVERWMSAGDGGSSSDGGADGPRSSAGMQSIATTPQGGRRGTRACLGCLVHCSV